MKSSYARRYRRSPSSTRETAMFKKESQQEHTFFTAPAQSFFKPHAAIQRKCAHCEAEEKKVDRMSNAEEEKKVHKKEEDKNFSGRQRA